MQRRKFLQSTGLISVPMLAPGLSFGASHSGQPSNDIVICLFQRGGADGLNMVVPHAEGDYYDLRPNLAIASNEIIDLDGFFGLHPAMSGLSDYWDGGELAIVHAAGSPNDSRSHFDAQDFMERGSPDQQANVFDGWVNRYLQQTKPAQENPFRAVGMGATLPLSLRGDASALSIATLAEFSLQAPAGEAVLMQQLLNAFYDNGNGLDDQAGSVFGAIDDLQLADPIGIPIDNGAQYPAGNFGRQMSELAKLIKADIGVEIACVETGGWDHHDQEPQQLTTLLNELSDGLAAFRQDMGDAMSRITIVTMTEFGRRAQENASMGTDHGHASVMMVLGAGVSGGIYGEWPGLGPSQLNRGDLEVTTDFRTVLTEVLNERAAAPLGQGQLDNIFPNFTGPAQLGIFS